MITSPTPPAGGGAVRLWARLSAWCIGLFIAGLVSTGPAHIIPPEDFHPVTESYRRMNFMLNLNPVLWEQVASDARVILSDFREIDAVEARQYAEEIDALISEFLADGAPLPVPAHRRRATRRVFELCTEAVAGILTAHLKQAEASLADHGRAKAALETARRIWMSFEHEVKATDPEGFSKVGLSWLELSSSLGSPGVMAVGAIAPDAEVFRREAKTIIGYVESNFGEPRAGESGKLLPLPYRSATFNPDAEIPAKLPPGHNINKQVPRPRQILNMAARGVDESETTLIAVGDMVFDSAYVFGEPARSLNITCNTCHNKSITNPQFAIPGLSSRNGGMDVSNSFFAPHANNGHFDPLDIPDLRGIRFTAPYGRNGRFASLREFVRNVIVNEFNGPEPEPMALDAIIAYMNEFDFLPNPKLGPEGDLSDQATDAERRGEIIFSRPFEQMGAKSCATCHVPSDQFLDRQRHDLGTVAGAERHSRDRAMDTPTLLSSVYSAPYFHDGSQPTLRSVNEWFNENFRLGLTENELDDLTAYVEAVGGGTDAYEDTPYYLNAEVEEFSFFLSAYEFLKSRRKSNLVGATFQTVASELRNHKWELQDLDYAPVMEELASLMDEAYRSNLSGDWTTTDAKVAQYRKLYTENIENLK